MEKLKSTLRFLFSNFGPIIIFYVANHFYGLKVAVASSVIWTIGEISLNKIRGKTTSLFFWFSACISIVFGIVDLSLQRSVLFKYEAAATSVLVGCFFASTLLGEKSIIQQFAESQGHIKKTISEDGVYYFKFLTVIWSLYQFAKAFFYFWIGSHYSLEEGLAIRGVVGNASMYSLLFISIFGSNVIKSTLSKLQLLPSSRISKS